ncbi:unnamed protein product [Diatraea saccharalis]|uniref:UDP-glucuronosyltransferase n=1 Tax=Diatraea saccharalis TaxID=40085 RepID=A0A9N9R9S2_9NEOP|nr:unnamed protein product [Diatraea saccharalis]
MPHILCLIFLSVVVVKNHAARILAVYPSPSISHQIVFRPLTLELIRRGHEVVVLTTHPVYRKSDAPANLTEIDLYDVSHDIWRKGMDASNVIRGSNNDIIIPQLRVAFGTMLKVVEKQLQHEEVKIILSGKKKFDLLIHEAFCLSALIFSHVLKVPAIQISSLGTVPDVANIVGAPSHPLLYPYPIYQKIYNLTIWDKLQQLYIYYQFQKIAQDFETGSDTIVQKLIGAKIPKLSELKKNVELVFLNVHSIWEMNRPMPPNVIYLGGLHQQPERKLPKDFQSYLDSSKHGVIYASFGTNIDPTLLPPHKIQILINVFSKLPYDILWKWNKDELHGLSDNIKISKWLPQADLLKHPKIKVFITQGGLQSTDEAIAGGVPLIGIPMVSDQWYNVEQYVHHGIGVRVDMETIDEEKFRNAINEILNNDSYRRNILRIKRIIDDQPQTSLERGVWWTEYVIRHGGAKHLRSPAANMSWTEYLELELFLYLWTTLMILIVGLIFMVYTLIGRKKMNGKLKSN